MKYMKISSVFILFIITSSKVMTDIMNRRFVQTESKTNKQPNNKTNNIVKLLKT